MAIDRRLFIKNMLVGTGVIYVFPHELLASSPCSTKHPLMPPNSSFKGECHNCGMKRSMWARTWHTYTSTSRTLEVCSLHCLAEAALNSGSTPDNVQVALYREPEKNSPVVNVHYVIGWQSHGTKTTKSYLAFTTSQEAATFADECGGSVGSFNDAYLVAMSTLEKET